MAQPHSNALAASPAHGNNDAPCLVLRDLSVTFPTRRRGDAPVTAIERIDAQVASREFVSIVGPSGCGKSTLLDVIAGLRRPSTGTIEFLGKPVVGPHPQLGVVFQEDSTFPWRTVRQNVEFGLEVRGMGRQERHARCQPIIDMVGLHGFEERYPHELSGGMRQRVAIARALARDPALLLMDEPFGALDQQTRLFLGNELLRIWDETHKTILFVTHDINEAVFLADHVWLMSFRPSHVKLVLTIDLPRPRTPDTVTMPRFHELTNMLWDALRPESERALKAEDVDGQETPA